MSVRILECPKGKEEYEKLVSGTYYYKEMLMAELR